MAAAGLSVISSFNNENRNILKNDDLPKAKSNKEVKVCIFDINKVQNSCVMGRQMYKKSRHSPFTSFITALFYMSNWITVQRLYIVRCVLKRNMYFRILLRL